jgi:hypothetical protein
LGVKRKGDLWVQDSAAAFSRCGDMDGKETKGIGKMKAKSAFDFTRRLKSRLLHGHVGPDWR